MKSLKAIAFVSILGGTLIHLAIFTVISIEGPDQRTPFPQEGKVLYVGNLSGDVGPAILEQAALLDSAPLFMPTKWNSVSEMSQVASLKEATEIFEPFPPQLRLPEFLPRFPQGGAAQSTASQAALPDGPAFILSRLGRRPMAQRAVSSQGPSVLIQLINGKPLMAASEPLPNSLKSLSPPALWNPARFYLQLSEGIPPGPPFLAQSSGFAEWDQALQGYIGSLEFYRNLADGYYLLAVFP